MNKKEIRTKEIFEAVDKMKSNLKQVFKAFSIKWNMNENSVRNFYYLQLKKLQQDKHYLEKCQINAEIDKQELNYFNEDEKEWLVKNILQGLNNGYSVRGICTKLANNDANLMIRYQNKYRAILKHDSKYLEEIANKYNIDYINNNKLPKNVIKINSNNNCLSDSEINSLFMGLVRLIKNNTLSQLNSVLKKEYQIATSNLKQVKNELRSVSEKLVEEQRKNKQLTQCLEFMKTGSKLKEFEKFLESIKNEDAK